MYNIHKTWSFILFDPFATKFWIKCWNREKCLDSILYFIFFPNFDRDVHGDFFITNQAKKYWITTLTKRSMNHPIQQAKLWTTFSCDVAKLFMKHPSHNLTEEPIEHLILQDLIENYMSEYSPPALSGRVVDTGTHCWAKALCRWYWLTKQKQNLRAIGTRGSKIFCLLHIYERVLVDLISLRRFTRVPHDWRQKLRMYIVAWQGESRGVFLLLWLGEGNIWSDSFLPLARKHVAYPILLA